jgi:signal transduction histidine kinase
MNPAIIPILYSVVIINIILSAIIFSRGFKNDFNLLFGSMSMAVAVWSFAIIGFYTDSLKFQFNWIALTHTTALFSALILLCFSISFPNRIYKNKILLVVLFLPMFVAVYYLFFTDKILGSIIDISYMINSWYVFYQVLLIIYFIGSYIALYIQFKNASDRDVRQQVKFIFIGCLFSSSFGSLTNLILPAIGIFQYTWLGPIFTFVLVASIFVAILRYHLFNIKFILTEFLSLVLVAILSIDVYMESDPTLVLVKTAVLVLVTVFSYFLIKSVYQEIKLRERIENLADDLEKANDNLAAANDRLKEVDQLKSEFLSLATHQIRAPLTAIKGYASLILEGDYGEIPESVKKPVQTIFDSCQSLVVIVNDFLNISRIEQGRMKYDLADFDLVQILTEVINELRPNVIAAGLFLDLRFDVKSCLVNADIGKIKQILNNLIDNSIKYTKQGGIIARLSVEQAKVVVEVSDTGIGIAPDDIPKLFTKFTRAKDAFRTNVIGTGLGLYIAKQMVEAQGGRIWVTSPGLGKGSTFSVELPRKQ